MRNCKENHLALPLRYHINNDYPWAKILIIPVGGVKSYGYNF